VADETPAVIVRDNRAESRYESELDGDLGMIVYRLRGDTITFTHTEVPETLEGRGIASAMARFALDDARARGLRVQPLCPFVAGYIRRHPEYADLVK
jgi:predicted GNAT family acetyltransferase